MKRPRESQGESSGSSSQEERLKGKDTAGKIVGLTLKMLDSIRGSRNELHSDPVLILNSERANGDRVFMWQAGGSGDRVYRIEVEVPKVFSSSLKEFVISCSCPDAFKRKDRTKRLCKHVFACLFTLIDWEANMVELEKEKRVFVEKQKKQEEVLDLKASIRTEQELQLPGERERILFGLYMYSQQNHEFLVDLLTQKVDQGTETLKLLSKLFTSEEMPPKSQQQLPCYRCGLNYDPQYEKIFRGTNKVTCRMAHPVSMVHAGDLERSHNGTTRYKLTCTRCSRVWFSENSTYQEGIPGQTGFCYSGFHCSDKTAVETEQWL